ncbi:MAG: MFS transporter [Bacillota bacterium]
MRSLFTRDFLLLWLGLSVSRLGDGAGFLAVMWWVQQETGSVMALSAVALAGSVPRMLLGPFAGVAADRYSRKSIIVWMDVVRGVVYLFLTLMAWRGTLRMPYLLGALIVSAGASQFFGPAVLSAVPQLVKSSHLERANSMNQMTSTIVSVAGTAFGGIVVALFGVPILLLINAASFLLSALSEVFIRLPSVKESGGLTWKGVVSDLKLGWGHVMQHRVLARVLQVSAALNFLFPPFFVLLPQFVAEDLSAGPETYGYLLSVLGAGSMAAMITISATSWIQRHTGLIIYGVMIQGVLLLTFALAPAQMLFLHYSSLFVFGFLNAAINIFFITIIQRRTDPDHMGKVFGLLETIPTALQPLSQGLVAPLAMLIPIRAVYAGCGVAISAVGRMVTGIPGLREFFLEADVSGTEVQTALEDGG